ncbi:hypothetical protein [Micropruina sp.]|uniref:hypothetical protein n=1 Tax=Micropruina sp. TaxID=2737536 RepID=UPI0026037581|nr:hypothetical protein [Micropruina sp.]
MRGKHIKRGFALAGITGLALTTTFLATPASARAELPAGPPAKEIVSHANTLTPEVKALMKGTGTAAEARALESYWTPGRMKAAKPFEKSPSMTRPGKAPQQQTQATSPEGKLGSVAPSRTSKAPKPTVKVAVKKGISPQYSQPNYPSSAPAARTNGKVFFSRGGKNWVCSASIVNSEGKSLVWTAGHCLAEDAVWSSNVSFVPAYSNGTRPYGTWYAKNLTTTTRWFNNHDWAYDVGAATMQANFGYRIADYLSSQGLMWNQTPKTYTAAAFGYPAASPFNGAYLYRADGTTADPNNGTLYMYSGLTGGSSGGPWFRNFDGNWGYVNGHNDFIYTNQPVYMYSPYYGNQVADLYNAVRYQSSDAVSGTKPTISGSATVGATLAANPGSWTPAPITLAYQWKANGSAISGATGSTLSVPASALGKAITVTVTGSKTGYTGASFTSDSTSYVAAGTLTGATPKISGTVKVGKKLTAKPGAWTPSDTALSYQWYRGSSPIKGATKSTYKLVKADKKKQISVKVTGTKAGYTTLTTTSAKTKKVK